MRYLDVCAGISASTVAWKPLGWKAAAYSEIEPAPRAVLAHHYPDTPLHGDFTTIQGDEYGPIDLLVGGTPCQDFSVAGLRAGLDGDRGNLSLEFLRLADRTRSRWVVWENVPGVLSIDGGRAFGAILGGLGELGYGFAYRVLDAQFFGVPQRRRRVFVVGCAGDWRGAAAVLSERHSLSGHPAPRREAGQGAAPGARDRAAFGGGNTSGSLDVAACLVAKGQKLDFEVETFVAEVTGTLPAGGNKTGGDRPPGMGQETADTMLVAYPINPNALRGDTRALTPSPDASGRLRLRDPGLRIGDEGDPAETLQAAGPGAVAFMENQRREVRISDHANLTVGGGKPGQGYPAAFTGSAVRRLTPRECERLQGFPDDYTLVPHRGKPMADGPRYKALGNSMAVPVMRWIGERIAAVDALTSRSKAA